MNINNNSVCFGRRQFLTGGLAFGAVSLLSHALQEKAMQQKQQRLRSCSKITKWNSVNLVRWQYLPLGLAACPWLVIMAANMTKKI